MIGVGGLVGAIGAASLRAECGDGCDSEETAKHGIVFAAAGGLALAGAIVFFAADEARWSRSEERLAESRNDRPDEREDEESRSSDQSTLREAARSRLLDAQRDDDSEVASEALEHVVVDGALVRQLFAGSIGRGACRARFVGALIRARLEPIAVDLERSVLFGCEEIARSLAKAARPAELQAALENLTFALDAGSFQAEELEVITAARVLSEEVSKMCARGTLTQEQCRAGGALDERLDERASEPAVRARACRLAAEVAKATSETGAIDAATSESAKKRLASATSALEAIRARYAALTGRAFDAAADCAR